MPPDALLLFTSATALIVAGCEAQAISGAEALMRAVAADISRRWRDIVGYEPIRHYVAYAAAPAQYHDMPPPYCCHYE